jgi:hypothetical protein
LQPEDGIIKKPKHVADLIIFYTTQVVLDLKLVYILLGTQRLASVYGWDSRVLEPGASIT